MPGIEGGIASIDETVWKDWFGKTAESRVGIGDKYAGVAADKVGKVDRRGEVDIAGVHVDHEVAAFEYQPG